jgi:ribosomal protein S16
MVVQEANRHPLSGRVVAVVGKFNPHTKQTTVDGVEVEKYLSCGAQPSPRVIRILKEQKVKLPVWVKEIQTKKAKTKHPEKRRKGQVEAAEATDAAEATEAAPVETDTVETNAAKTDAAGVDAVKTDTAKSTTAKTTA